MSGHNTRRGANQFPRGPQGRGAPMGHNNNAAVPQQQRRNLPSNNFVSGGQLKSSSSPQQQKTMPSLIVEPSQQQQQQHSLQGTVNFIKPAVPLTPVKKEIFPPVQQEIPSFPQPSTSSSSAQLAMQSSQSSKVSIPLIDDVPIINLDPDENKKWFFKTKGGKIAKSEKIRRRNMKLSKILQPKNAVMILNELVRGCNYNVDELPTKIDANQFRGTVSFDGQEFAGTGRTKIAAKNAAAETALKHLVKSKQLTNYKKDDDGDELIDATSSTGDIEEIGQVMPWSHIASFAMYKLFSSWGEDLNLINKTATGQESNIAANQADKAANIPKEPKPAKKMPENPETINPLMLIHQMLPNAVWQETLKTGNPPNVVFTFTVTVDDKQFVGAGSSKKIAKRLAAYAACQDILKVQYPSHIWTPPVF